MILFTEAIKLKDGRFCHLEYHQARVETTTTRFYGTHIDLSEALSVIPDEAKEGLCKCRVVYGSTIRKIVYQPYLFRDIKSVGLVVDNEIEYSYKYADRGRLLRLVTQKGSDEILIIKNGFLTDASFSNLVFVKGENLDTPADCLLYGTKRQYLIDKKMIRERRIRPQDIQHYDRLIFINAMMDLEDDIGIETGRIIGVD